MTVNLSVRQEYWTNISVNKRWMFKFLNRNIFVNTLIEMNTIRNVTRSYFLSYITFQKKLKCAEFRLEIWNSDKCSES